MAPEAHTFTVRRQDGIGPHPDSLPCSQCGLTKAEHPARVGNAPVVIAATITRGEQVARDAGIQRPIVLSPYSIRHHGAGRGLVPSLVLVDSSALPLDAHTLDTIDAMLAAAP